MKTNFKSKDDILAEIKLLDHALINGYQIDKAKTSTIWIKLKSSITGDNIMINSQKNLYYNLDYDNDKGDLIQFVANRLNGSLSVDKTKEGFYKAMVYINKDLGNYLKEENKSIINKKNHYLEKKSTILSMQDKEWNHVSIVDYNFLNNSRAISMETLKSNYFQDNLFNTYFKTKSDHLITNTAFGLYKQKELVGVEIRNNTIKMILGDHDGVFITNTTGMKSIDAVFYAESGIDIASYIEILKANKNFLETNNCCFLSFSGNLYDSKMNTIIDELDLLPISEKTLYISITDNDLDKEENKNNGKIYDVTFTAALINKHITPLEFSTNDTFFNYQFTNKIDLDIHALKEFAKIQNDTIDATFDVNNRYGKYVVLKETEDNLTLYLPKNCSLEAIHYSNLLKIIKAENLYKTKKPIIDWNKKELEKKINSLNYIPLYSDDPKIELIKIMDSKEYKPHIANDWNEELKLRKGFKIEKKIENIIDTKITLNKNKNAIKH